MAATVLACLGRSLAMLLPLLPLLPPLLVLPTTTAAVAAEAAAEAPPAEPCVPLAVELDGLGRVDGVAAEDDGGGSVFWGIPYAAPPVGDRRFAPPAPAPAWAPAAWDASYARAACLQLDVNGDQPVPPAHEDEDCLYLNVFTPPACDDDGGERLPVLVWFHGGAFSWGYAHYYVYDGAALSAAERVVVVTVAYRLGPFGFLADPSLLAPVDGGQPTAGNYGILDQQLALAFVRDHIGQFGGDPSRVTVFGWSAGGASVLSHLLSPRSAGLFSAAIAESGLGGAYSPTIEDDGYASAEALAALVGCADAPSRAACLRAVPAADVIRACLGAPRGEPVKSWGPVVDGVVLPAPALAAVRAGAFYRVPVLVGDTSTEASWGLPFYEELLGEFVYTWPATRASARLLYGANNTDEVWPLYNRTVYGDAIDATLQLISNYAYICPIRLYVKALAAYVPTSYYIFDHAPSWGPPHWGAYHQSEMWFVFGHPQLNASFTPDEAVFSRQMMAVWAEFARTHRAVHPVTGVPWPLYDPETQPYAELDLVTELKTGFRRPECDTHDRLLPAP